MGSLAIITGSPGAGKTTLAARLSTADPRGVHLPGDAFYRFLAHPFKPTLPESDQQNEAVIAATTQTAAVFASSGYQVYMEGIFGPWFLPVIARVLAGVGLPVSYLVLRLGLEEALRRIKTRSDGCDENTVRQMHAAFANLGEYEPYVIGVDGLTPEALVTEFERLRPACVLDLAKVNSAELAGRAEL